MTLQTPLNVELNESTRLILARAAKARDSFDEFLRFVIGISPADHQQKWVKALQAVADKPQGARLLIVAPPGSGKTTIMVAFMAFMIGRSPDRYHGLLSYADQVGWARSRAVKELIEKSKYYRLVFPEVKRGDKWGDTEFIVERAEIGSPQPTLRAGGTNSSVISYRINGLLIDDPHDQKNSASATQRQKVYDNYEAVVKTRLTYGRHNAAWVVVIGTRWADEDLIGRLSKQKGWQLVETKALHKTPDGLRSFWEMGFPLDELEQIRFESPSLFALQYMNDTSGGETGIIRSVKTYYETPEEVITKRDLVIAAAWDTALKDREHNDFSVCYVGGLGRDGRVYLLDRFKERYSTDEILTISNNQYEKYKKQDRPLWSIFFEDSAQGTPAVTMLRANLPHIPTDTTPATSGGKRPRAHALAPYLHNGQVLLPAFADWTQDSKYNLTYFPFTDHYDDIDALYILVTKLLEITHPHLIQHRPQGPRIEMR